MADPGDLQLALYILGPWLIGVLLDLFLQGILACQFAHYISLYPDDKRGIRLLVLGLAIITFLKSAQSIYVIWVQDIVNAANIKAAVNLNYTTWQESGNPLMVAFCGLYVQTYFIWRLWVISGKWYVVVPPALLAVFGFLAISVATYFITIADNMGIAHWFAAHLSSVFAADMTICLTTAYFLIKTKKNVLPQTVGVLNALIRLSFQTAAPAAICAMFNLMFSQIYLGTEKLVSTAFNNALPKLYAISMMWTLNARRNIRVSQSRAGHSSSRSNNDLTFRSRRRNEHELGNMNGIQVHTEIETVQHVDVRSAIASQSSRDDKVDIYSHSISPENHSPIPSDSKTGFAV